MTTETDGITPHPPFPLDAANRLLDLLSTDDAFRSLFTSDPAAALQQIGLSSSAVETALKGKTCLEVKALATKQEIIDTRTLLQDRLMGIDAHTHVFCFEAGQAGHGA